MKQEESFTEEDNEKESLLFDTYAFVEIIKGNSNYLPYTNKKIITTRLNIFELYHGCLKDNNEPLGEEMVQKYFPFIRDFDQEVIKAAAKLKYKLNKRNLSMTDCIGYTFAKQLGIKFLTGDKEFQDMDNVEFVK